MFKGINDQDLAKLVTCKEKIYGMKKKLIFMAVILKEKINAHVVVIDYGVKKNILRCLSSRFEKISLVPCTSSYSDIINLNPDGVFLSNGPRVIQALPENMQFL